MGKIYFIFIERKRYIQKGDLFSRLKAYNFRIKLGNVEMVYCVSTGV